MSRINLNKTELKIISKLLEMAENKFSNHGCNDISTDFWDGMDKEYLSAMLQEIRIWNGDLESPWPEELNYVHDDSLMAFFADKLKIESETT